MTPTAPMIAQRAPPELTFSSAGFSSAGVSSEVFVSVCFSLFSSVVFYFSWFFLIFVSSFLFQIIFLYFRQ